MFPGTSTYSHVHNVDYHFSIPHRDHRPDKSQWLISCQSELALFEATIVDAASAQKRYWNLQFLEDGRLQQLGSSSADSPLPLNPLYIALFIRGAQWHGYPADPQIKRSDIPHLSIIRQWVIDQKISKRKGILLSSQRPWAA